MIAGAGDPARARVIVGAGRVIGTASLEYTALFRTVVAIVFNGRSAAETTGCRAPAVPATTSWRATSSTRGNEGCRACGGPTLSENNDVTSRFAAMADLPDEPFNILGF